MSHDSFPRRADEDSDAGMSDPVLELFKTGLRVQDGELQRVNAQGGITMRLPLGTIESVEFRTGFDPFCLVFITVGSGLGAVGYMVSENNLLTSLLYAAGILLVGFGLLGCVVRWVRVCAPAGTIHIQCNDLIDEGEGFVCSLQALIGGAKGPHHERS